MRRGFSAGDDIKMQIIHEYKYPQEPGYLVPVWVCVCDCSGLPCIARGRVTSSLA